MRAAVDFEPFLLRAGADEPLEIAARVQALPAPVRCRQERHLDLREVGAALAVVLAVHLAGEECLPHVLSIACQFVFAERLRPADELTGIRILLAAAADAVLHGLHLHVLPVLAEAADDAAVPRTLAVGIVPAFPRANRCEVRRLGRRRAP